jgi:hypothetical protein
MGQGIIERAIIVKRVPVVNRTDIEGASWENKAAEHERTGSRVSEEVGEQCGDGSL